MDFLLDAITTWLKEMLVGGIMSNLSSMFDSVNNQVADISGQIGQTPQGWNAGISAWSKAFRKRSFSP